MAKDGPKEPISNADNGRTKNGKFAKGNAGGPGNPYARRVAELRRLLTCSVTEEDIMAIGQKLVQQSKAGDIASIKILLGYILGQPAPFESPDEAIRQDARLKV